MPIGFAKSILAQGTTATGANEFLNYDGSNDQTLTRNAAVLGFLGAGALSDEYAVSFHITDAGGSSLDLIRYDVLRNNSGTLSIASQDNSWLTTSSSSYSNFGMHIAQTNAGNLFAHKNDMSNPRAAIFSLSGSTVTKHTDFNANMTAAQGGRIHRRPGTDQFVNITGRGAEIVTLTDNGNSSSMSTAAETTISSSEMHYNNARAIHGFKDANTVLMWKSVNNSAPTADTIVPFEVDLTSTGSQSVSPISGVSAVDLDLDPPVTSSNVFDFSNEGQGAFPTTDFNSTLMFFERDTQNTPGALRIYHYTSGDSSITSSNTLTLASGGTADISPSGCFVGSNNDVFLFAYVQPTNTIPLLKFVISTNTLSQIATISESMNVEKLILSRWGNNAALLQYNDTKMRLIKP